MNKTKIRYLLFNLGILFFIYSHSTANMREIPCKVVGISDGDSLTCLYDRTQLKVRLLYIDAPEATQPFGNRAKQTLAHLAFNKQVTLFSSGYDQYGRMLAVVKNERGDDLNLKLVQAGMAWAYRQTLPIYQQAQNQAQTAKIGLWQDKNPINPADWRTNKRSDSVKNLQNFPQNRPLAVVNCSLQLSCGQMEEQGFSYAQVERYFHQCGWKTLDGNGDGIPCNRLYRQSQRR
ncbi:nuclease [Pasteurellaceae bacterium Orientalotternb1]|nr:nuclease [Pasteurellaceae bacterium Orientalotternb1]